MLRIVFLFAILGIIVPALLFGRAVAVVRGLAIGLSLWASMLILWIVGDMLKWFEPSLGFVLLVCLIVFSLDIVILAILASLVVSKPDEVIVVKVAIDAYKSMPPEAQAATKRVAAAFARRMAEKRKPGLVADILTEVSKGLT